MRYLLGKEGSRRQRVLVPLEQYTCIADRSIISREVPLERDVLGVRRWKETRVRVPVK